LVFIFLFSLFQREKPCRGGERDLNYVEKRKNNYRNRGGGGGDIDGGGGMENNRRGVRLQPM